MCVYVALCCVYAYELNTFVQTSNKITFEKPTHFIVPENQFKSRDKLEVINQTSIFYPSYKLF